MDRSDKEVTEVTFEVTVRHFVTASDPNPYEIDVERGVEAELTKRGLDLESVTAVRI